MRHLKRQKIPKSWPVNRKGTKYVVRPNSNLNKGIPILILLRDILNIAQNRKEVKKAIHNKLILLNSMPVRDDKESAQLFDTLTLIPNKKNYRIELNEKGKFVLKEINENEASKKISKITNKKMLNGKKIQINLSDGRNYLTDIKCKVGDSVIVDLRNKKIEKCLEFKDNSQVFVFAGKHTGKTGITEKIDKEKKIARINHGKESINALIKQIIVLE